MILRKINKTTFIAKITAIECFGKKKLTSCFWVFEKKYTKKKLIYSNKKGKNRKRRKK
jgi:hypothetical protein